MPKPPAHVLIWSAENGLYVLHTSGYPPQVLTPGNEDVWHAWLLTHVSFSFQGQHGHLNVLKETRPRGTGYWYAYHKNSGRNRKRYLGQGANVTFARLEEIARELQEAPPETLPTQAPASLLTTQHGHKTLSGTVPQADEQPDPSNMIILTRFSPPSLPATLVVRERLLFTLDAALSRPLTLLSASAGWGKTTLLATWVQKHPQSVAWLTLEEMDNDPMRFWISVIEALRRCRPGIGEQALSLLQTPAPSLAPLATSLTALLNELANQHAEASPILLILDDYHVINEPTIHTSLTFWLEHLPPHVHLLLASRVDPDLPLARLRVRSYLAEIRDTDLRFTREETQSFLTQRMSLALSENEIELLQARTEGWIASLHLAALILQKHADPSAYVQALSGSQRYLLDYMREEVLAHLPETLQDFLLQTCELPQLNASLCDAIRDREDSARLLEQVERANLFLLPLDESRQWYRYHALWAQAMQHEARARLGTTTLRLLRNKASRWYEQQSLLPEAIEAALAGEDFARAASLIERFIIPQSFRNSYHTLSRWLRQLPEEIMRNQPDLCFQSVLALTFTTDRRSPATWEYVGMLLQWAGRGFEALQEWEKLGETLQLQAELAFFQDDLVKTLRLARQARPLLTRQSLIYPENLVARGVEAYLAGEMEIAWQCLLEGYRRAKHFGNHSSTLTTSLLLGGICLEKGELRKAAQHYHQALAHTEEDQETFRQQLRLETGEAEPFFASWIYHCLAQLSYEQNEMANAQRYLSQALSFLSRPEEGIHVFTSGSLIQARLLHASGKTAQAQAVLLKWEGQTRIPWSLRAIRTCQARLHLAAGALSAVELWAQEKQRADQSQPPDLEEAFPLILQQEEGLLLVRLHLAQGHGEAALKALAPWQEIAHAQGRKRSILEIQILEALAHVALHAHSQARSSLLQALRLAQPENYQRLFLDEGPALEALLKTLLPDLREASLISYTRTLLRAFAQGPDARPAEELTPIGKVSLPVESLSEQERRVLRLLVVGRSNPEIARELVISVNTVKTHVQSLYRKLDVHNRTEAGEVARRLSLLSSF
ncbi:transcriptional regulator [Ktedonosporobacter rubrisoli]|uniref:Transcriptional regulator n=1 Tax=Ktedonosporobacter rubrisoli TaxID=2509675 RepID=A0A4P6JQV6_KTERU|nr:LuxR C-terminal-related transcriptional regulator [Ktedonosporobacter rubrisoli]QBD77653.1 transcriptional regulator [Ktedonosporobacter rubrisoli]